MNLLNCKDEKINFSLSRKKSEPLLTAEEAKQIEQLLEASKLSITEIVKTPTRVKPKAPFITSTLQQAASTKIRLQCKKNHACRTKTL